MSYRDIILQDNPNPGGRFFIENNALWDRVDIDDRHGKGDEISPVMQDAEYERLTNQIIIDRARGDVLIFGLGIGLIVYPIMQKLGVSTILIVEKHQEVLDIIMPQTDFNNRVTVVQGSWHDYVPQGQYDTIWLDDWTAGSEDIELRAQNVIRGDSRRQFLDRFTPYVREGGWIGHWWHAT